MPDSRPPPGDPLSPYQQALRERFPSVEAITAAADARRREANPRARRSRRRAGGCLAAGAWLADPAYRTESLSAEAAPRTVQLADGSSVTLDQNTRLTVQWRLRSRALALERGKRCSPWPTGPRAFTVTAGQTRVRDIGTIFDVQRLPQRTRVVVLEGVVEVETGGQVRQLRAGQRLDVAPDGQPGDTVTVDAERALAWQRGKFTFDGATLADAIAEMQPHSRRALVIDDPRVAQLRLSGEFDRDQVAAILQLLPGILPVTVRQAADGTVHLGARQRS